MFNPYDENSGEYWLVVAGVPPTRIEDCLEWAFGKLDPEDDARELLAKWNKRHSDIFYINQGDSVMMALLCIGKAFAIDVLKTSKEDPRVLRKNMEKR